MTQTTCELAATAPGQDTGVTQWLDIVPLIVAAAITLVTWAGAFVAISIAMRELSPAPFALARIGSAGLVLLLAIPFLPGNQLRLPRLKDWPAIAFMALLAFPIYHTALNVGQQVVPAGVASLLIATIPIFATIVARFTLQESLPLRGWLGVGIGFAGIALLVTGGQGLDIEASALFILLAALSGAGFMVTQRHLTRRYSGLSLTVWGIWFGTLVLLPFAPQLFSELRAASSETLWAVAYIGTLPTALAYVTWAYVLKSLPAARATSLLYFVPPMAFAFAWLIIGSVPTWLDLASGVVIIAGVILVQKK